MFFHGRTIYGIRTQTIDEGNGSTFIYQLHRRSYVLTTPKTTPKNHPDIEMLLDKANDIFVYIPPVGFKIRARNLYLSDGLMSCK